jgi:hypothetical protein
MENGWSMKHLHRLIATSSVYRQSAAATDVRRLASLKSEIQNPKSEKEQSRLTFAATNKERDPENRLLWRMNPGQMEAEVLRDSILFLAGELDLTPVGYPLPNADAERSHHRSLYFSAFPNRMANQFAEMFDPPNPIGAIAYQTILPQQALFLNVALQRIQVLSRAVSQKIRSEEGGMTQFTLTAAQNKFSLRSRDEGSPSAGPSGQTIEDSETYSAGKPGACAFNHNDFATIR